MLTWERPPLDIETGLPLVVLGESAAPNVTNYHHHWFPRRHEHLEGSLPYVTELEVGSYTLHELGGLVVRMSRGQVMPIDVHVQFHRRYRLDPVLPETLRDKFEVAVKGCSGVVPRTAARIISPTETQFVHIDQDEFERISRERLILPEHHYYWHHKEKRRAVLGEFFVRYALLQDLSGAPEKVVREFLETNDQTRRRQLGMYLLKEVFDASINPVRPQHAELRRRGSVLTHVPDVLTSIKKQLVPFRMPRYLNYLADRLQMA